MKKEEKPKPQVQPQSNRLRIGLLVVSVVVGVLLALVSIMSNPH